MQDSVGNFFFYNFRYLGASKCSVNIPYCALTFIWHWTPLPWTWKHQKGDFTPLKWHQIGILHSKWCKVSFLMLRVVDVQWQTKVKVKPQYRIDSVKITKTCKLRFILVSRNKSFYRDFHRFLPNLLHFWNSNCSELFLVFGFSRRLFTKRFEIANKFRSAEVGLICFEEDNL